MPLDKPSKMTFSLPGTRTVSATVALMWTEMLVDTIFAALVGVELTLSCQRTDTVAMKVIMEVG